MAKRAPAVTGKKPDPAIGSTGISDAAVRAATDRGWPDWFAILDSFDVKANGHKAAARHVRDKYGCADWWSQMVVVGYERARGLRAKHERPDGYSVSASKTIAAPAAEAFRALADARVRRAWLPGVRLEVRKSTAPKSLRITCRSGFAEAAKSLDGTNVDVNLVAKGADKCQIQVEHSGLADAAVADRLKAEWQEALVRLKGRLEA